jgi:hypothetical protein
MRMKNWTNLEESNVVEKSLSERDLRKKIKIEMIDQKVIVVEERIDTNIDVIVADLLLLDHAHLDVHIAVDTQTLTAIMNTIVVKVSTGTIAVIAIEAIEAIRIMAIEAALM